MMTITRHKTGSVGDLLVNSASRVVSMDLGGSRLAPV